MTNKARAALQRMRFEPDSIVSLFQGTKQQDRLYSKAIDTIIKTLTDAGELPPEGTSDSLAYAWAPINTAIKDGRWYLLLIDNADVPHEQTNPLEDTERYSRTIGFNNGDDDGEDKWQFIGWCWSHDHFVEQGRGTPVMCAPLLPAPEMPA